MSSSHQKTFRRPQSHKPNSSSNKSDFQVDGKYRVGVAKLQELFPNWSEQDLQSVLVEVNGDVETAVVRISEGHAEQWGNVSRKKDKKPPHSSATPPIPSHSPAGTPPPRGARGGRGGLGARGVRGGGPGRSFSPRDVNGHGHGRTSRSTPQPDQNATTNLNGVASTSSGWGTAEPSFASDTGKGGGEGDEGDTWGAEWGASEPTHTDDKWSASQPAKAAPNGPSVSSTSADPVKPVPVKSVPVVVGSKLSWAQIARPQEKPKPSPSPAPPILAEGSNSNPEAEAEPPIEPHSSSQESQWDTAVEEPTTVQVPSWDDEPVQQPRVSTPHKDNEKDIHVDEEGWMTNQAAATSPATAALSTTPPMKDQIQTPNISKSPAVGDLSTPALTTTPSTTASTAPSAVAPTPPPATTSAASAASKARNNRFKSDQPVVMPSFGSLGGGAPFGTFGSGLGGQAGAVGGLGLGGAGLGNIGMQFGSLSIGDDAPIADGAPELNMSESMNDISETEKQGQGPGQSQSQNQLQTQTQSNDLHPPPPNLGASSSIPPPVTSSTTQHSPLASLASANFFQPQTQTQPPPQQPQQPQPTTYSSGSFNPLGQPQQTQQSQPQSQMQAQTQPLYVQHGLGLPSHQSDSNTHTPPIPVSAHQQQAHQSQNHLVSSSTGGISTGSALSGAGPGSYYRQQDYVGFTPSNPNSILSQQQQAQQQQQVGVGIGVGDAQSGGGVSSGSYTPFSNLTQAQNQMAGFNPGQDFSAYGDQRGFYDGYAQQSGFTSRNFLGQDDLGKLPPTAAAPHQQQQQNTQTGQLTNSLSTAAVGGASQTAPSLTVQSQPSQSQGPTNTTTGAGQTQQGGYPGVPPVPYYYNPYYQQPHNPYYTPGPNPGYGVGLGQPFMNMKYPMYPQAGVPPGPTGPGTPSGQGTKAGSQNVNVPPQQHGPASYSAHSGLYGQAGYDDGYVQPHQHQHQTQQASAADYGKPPLYGLNHQTLLTQSARVQQQSQQVANQAGQSTSPENAYKPYGGKGAATDPSSGGNVRGAVQPSYGGASAGRFGANVNPPPPGMQGQGNYPQGGLSESGNYYQQYQRPQYWQ